MLKKSLLILKMVSIGIYILLCFTMFVDIENRLIEKLNTTNSNGFIITFIGLGISIIMYLLRLKQENTQDSIANIYQGCVFFFIFIIINLMDTHIISTIFYFIIRITLGYLYQFIHYAVYTWTAGLALKIGLGIFLVVALSAIFIAIMYYVMLPSLPIVFFLSSVLGFIGECFADSDNSSKSSQGSSNSGVSIGEIIEACAEDKKRADIKRAADELEKIRYEISK